MQGFCFLVKEQEDDVICVVYICVCVCGMCTHADVHLCLCMQGWWRKAEVNETKKLGDLEYERDNLIFYILISTAGITALGRCDE